uniref:Uncharacterized protein n=1 Tax=Plectus sambesii TaxID=2011161 RepID=A0A914W0Z6_9BILA
MPTVNSGKRKIEEILDDILQQINDVDEEEEGGEDEGAQQLVMSAPPSRKDVLAALSVLYAYFKNKNADLSNLNALADQLFDMNADHFVQKKITDYFK